MGVYTLEDFREELLFSVGGARSTSNAFTTTRLDRWINGIYYWISNPAVIKHGELETTEWLTLATDTVEYATTAYFREITSVRVVESTDATPSPTARPYKLDPGSIREFDENVPPTGRASEYVIWNNKVVIDRVPDTTWVGRKIGVRGITRPIPLVAGAATLLDALWDHIIHVGTQMYAWNALGLPDMVEAAREDFGRLVADQVSLDEQSGEDTLPQQRLAEPYGPMGGP